MSWLFVCYPKCSTCKKAETWLQEHNFRDYIVRNIKEDNPAKEELKEWIDKSGLELKRFFNTSGMLYKEKNLKKKLPEMNEEEKLSLLAESGMLVKRPLLITEDKVLVGFREKEWQDKLLG